MTPGQDSVERMRRHEVSRALKKIDLSPEAVGVIDLLSRSLVGKLLDGPISEVLARAEAEIPFARLPGPEVASRGLEGNGGGAESSGPETPNCIRGNGAYYIELEIGSDGIFSKPARSNGETGGTGDRSISVI